MNRIERFRRPASVAAWAIAVVGAVLGGSAEVDIEGESDGKYTEVSGTGISGNTRKPKPGTTSKPRPPVSRTRPMDPGECSLAELTANPGVAFWCSAAIGESAGCAEDERFRVPYLRSVWEASTGAWGPWTLYRDAGCEGDGDPGEGDVGAEIEREIKRLELKGSPLGRSPGTAVTYVQTDTIVWTDAVPQVFDLTVLGQAVELEMTPVQFSWDFGDGSRPLVTTKTGGPYPDKSVSHVYTRLETVQIRLTTTWSGRYRLAGSQEWLPVSGLATTTSVDDPLELREYRTRLVAGPLED